MGSAWLSWSSTDAHASGWGQDSASQLASGYNFPVPAAAAASAVCGTNEEVSCGDPSPRIEWLGSDAVTGEVDTGVVLPPALR